MLASGWIQFFIYVVLLLAITKPLGIFLCKILDPSARTFLDPVLKPVERLLYRLLRVNPQREHNWKQYAVAMLVFSGISMLFTYVILRTQQWLPLNYGFGGSPVHAFGPLIPHLAFNTAASFTTNTNWQNYGGENTMGYFAQMVALASHNFFSAAVGIAIAAVIVRGIARDKSKTVGNFWADLVRIHLYLLLPICIVYATFLVSQGMVQNFKPYQAVTYLDQPAAPTPATQPTSQPATTQPVAALAELNGPSAATFLSAGDIPTGPSAALAQATQAATASTAAQPPTEPAATQPATQPGATRAAATPPVTTQIIPGGPVASQVAIKMLGTNGGGFFNANAAYPFENPTPLSNLIQILSIFAIPSALTWYLGHTVKNQRHGWAVWAAMFLVFASLAIFCWWAEAKGNPRVTELGVTCADGTTGNMEGKEVRFGIFNSALFATITTDASCGAVNSMHDSYTPLGGLVPLVNIQLGEVIFGGVGAGLYGMLVFVVIAIFIAGLMVGRTPEYLGKKIESYDVKVASLSILILTFSILCFTAYASASRQFQRQ